METARRDRRVLINNLSYVNHVTDLELPRPSKEMVHYWFTSRGCPFQCRFCNLPMGRRFRHIGVESREGKRFMINWLIQRLALEFSPKIEYSVLLNMLEGAEDLYQKGLKLEIGKKIEIQIWDDNFLVDRKRIMEFSGRLQELGLHKYFNFVLTEASVRTFYHSGELDTELMDSLKASSFRGIFFGTDGLSTSILNQFDKGYNIDKAIKLNNELKKRGFVVAHNLILTSPLISVTELTEVVMLFYLLPFSYTFSMGGTVYTSLGSIFTNMDLINYPLSHRPSIINPSLIGDFKEYEIPFYFTPLTIADPKVNVIVKSLTGGSNLRDVAKSKIIKTLQAKLGEEYIYKVIDAWQSSDEPEIRALGICLTRSSYIQDSVFLVMEKIKAEMQKKKLFSFKDYLDSGEGRHGSVSSPVELSNMSLSGLGKGPSAASLLESPNKKVEAAKELLGQGKITAACILLRNAIDNYEHIIDDFKASREDTLGFGLRKAAEKNLKIAKTLLNNPGYGSIALIVKSLDYSDAVVRDFIKMLETWKDNYGLRRSERKRWR